MSETFDDLSAFSRQELYSIINTLKREINCLSTDLLRLQLLANKYQKYTKYLEIKPNKCDFDYKYIRDLNILKVCKNCFIGLNQLNANHFPSDNLNENNVSEGCRERSDELVDNNEDINRLATEEEADDNDMTECNINYVSNEVIINDCIDDNNECDVTVEEPQSTDEDINVSNDGQFLGKKLNTNQEKRLKKQRSCSVDKESVVDDYNGSDSDYKPEEVESRGSQRSPKKDVKMGSEALKSRKFKCDVDGCDKVYTTQRHLNYHQKSHQIGGRYYCGHPECWRHFATPIKLQSHRHLLSNIYLCGHNDECVFQTKSQQELDEHYAAEHPSGLVMMLPCGWEGCESKLIHTRALAIHMHHHWRTAGTKCGICLMTFATTDLLVEHRADKHLAIHQCDQCDYKTQFKYSLTKHLMTHRLVKPHKCLLNGCSKKFYRVESLTGHQLLIHPEEFPLVPWLECPKCIFRTKYDLTMRRHGLKPCPVQYSKRQIGSISRLVTNKTDDDNNNEDNNQTNAKRRHSDGNDSGSDDCHEDSNLMINDNSGSDEEYKPEKELKAIKFVPKKRQKLQVSTGAGKKYRCNACDFATDRKPEMFVHRVRQHTSEKRFECQLGVDCNLKFKTNPNLRRHQLFRHPEEFPDVPWLECPQPNCTFRTKVNERLKIHISKSKGHRTVVSKSITKVSYICDWIGCGRRCVSDTTMTAHIQIHTMDNLKDCVCDHPGCDESFSKPGHLREHKLTHHSTAYRCGADGCPYVTGLFSAIKEHLSVQHNGQRPPVFCGINGCNKLLAISHPIRHQYISHPKEFPEVPWIECQDCLYRTKYYWTMIGHKDSHTKPFPCDVCDRAFGTRISRDEHLRTHNDDLKLKCDWYGCEARFTTDDARRDHFNTHTEATIYRCEWPGCDKTFLQRTSLIHHKRKHRQQSTAVNSQMVSHLSNSVVHRCHWPECEFETRYEKSLNRHIDTLHKGLQTSAIKSGRKKPKRKRKRW